jgi:hypothetical protein
MPAQDSERGRSAVAAVAGIGGEPDAAAQGVADPGPVVAGETAIVARVQDRRRTRFPRVASPDILGNLGTSLLRSGRVRPRERRPLRSAKEALPSVGQVHDKTWPGASDGSAKLMGTAARYAPMGIFESSGSK